MLGTEWTIQYYWYWLMHLIILQSFKSLSFIRSSTNCSLHTHELVGKLIFQPQPKPPPIAGLKTTSVKVECLPKSIIEVMHVVYSYSFVNAPYVLG
jgi:hypothetical protein